MPISKLLLCALTSTACFAVSIDLHDATVVIRPGDRPNAEKTAAIVLLEELQKRTGLELKTSTTWPKNGPVIAITSKASVPEWAHAIPPLTVNKPDSYRLFADVASNTVWIAGADPRATLYGVGQLLRRLDWSGGKLSLDSSIDITTSPAYPIRGHQLGYRAQANSYDAWSPAQFEQYIRELTFFGVNAIEGIPFEDDRPTPVIKFSRREMNRAIGDICHRYGLEYWIWLPAVFDLKDTAKRTQLLNQFAEFSRDTTELSGIFFPGGDPGSNPPELVLPFLEDVAKQMQPAHPQAKVWLSLQWFTKPQVDSVYQYISQSKPPWFAGLVAGPSGPPIPETRQRLPKQYKLRLYPDFTHNKICQYQVPSWDLAYSLTLGREAINPRPAEFTMIHNRFAPYSDGFISYSDGVHDDVNKTVFSSLSWDPSTAVRDILIDYGRVFFAPATGDRAADGILALERNWRGALIDNGGVDGTLLLWQQLERENPRLESNWRWQMCLLRANYDAYVRRRLLYETQLEKNANVLLAASTKAGSEKTMTAATDVLNQSVKQPASPELRARIVDLCEKLFQSIGLQTSVEKYHAINAERGAVLDFIDLPLNNRWWLEDEFKKVRSLSSESAKVSRLQTLAFWENPGPGSYYDNVGNIAKSPRVVRSDSEGTERGLIRESEPSFWWWDQGKSRTRLSFQVTLWPREVVYEGLDPKATYVVRSSGYGQALLRVNGERVEPASDGKEMGDVKEFPVAAKYFQDSKLVLTWDAPVNESKLNWRNKSRLAEVWLIKK